MDWPVRSILGHMFCSLRLAFDSIYYKTEDRRSGALEAGELAVDVWDWVLIGGVSLFAIIIYVSFMIFFPEWVGISKKEKTETTDQENSSKAD